MKLTQKEFLLFGILLYFTFIGGTFYSQLNLFLRVFNQIWVTAIVAGWLGWLWRNQKGLPAIPLDKAIGLYLVATFVSAWLGQAPRFSLEMWWFSLTHTLAFYLLVDLARRGWGAGLTWAFYMASAVVCLVGLAEFLAWYFGTPLFPAFAQGWAEIGGWQQIMPPFIYRLAVTLNGSTPLSAYLALLTPPAIALLLTLSRQDQNRPALWVWLALATMVQVLTFSRAGILALAVSLSLTALGWYYVAAGHSFSLWAQWRSLSTRYRLWLIAGLVTLMVLGLAWLQGSFANRAGSTQFRFGLWQVALTTFQDHFLTGAGPANFGRALLRLNQPELPRLQISSAHNVYLNTAAELGLLGLLAGAYLLWSLGQAYWQHWGQLTAAPPPERFRFIAAGTALLGLMAQTLVDTYSATPNILVIVAVAAYLVRDMPGERSRFQARFSTLLPMVLLVGYAFAFVWLARADWHFQRSFQAEGKANLAEAIAEAEQARSLDPFLPMRTFRLAFLQARLAAQTNNVDLTQAAISHYEAGLAQEPIWGLNSANLAGLLWQHDQHAKAIQVMEQTVAAEKEPLYLLNLGYFYEQARDWEQATAAYGQALALDPDLASSGFWTATPERAAHWPKILTAVRENPETTQQNEIKLALARAEFAQVEILVGPVSNLTDPELRLALVEADLSQAHLDKAAALLNPMNPQTAREYLLSGRLNLQLGRPTVAEKQLKTATFWGEYQAYTYLGQLYEQNGQLKAAEAAYARGFSPHYISENIEITIYGRSGSNDLVPQLLRIGVGPVQAAPWLALARLYEAQARFAEAKQLYELLLLEDPFLKVGQERLSLLKSKSPD
jgi:tetratricopeptide (TPR) repeat protein